MKPLLKVSEETGTVLRVSDRLTRIFFTAARPAKQAPVHFSEVFRLFRLFRSSHINVVSSEKCLLQDNTAL